jgi:acetyl esterase
MDLMKEHNIPMPAPKVDTMGQEIPVKGGSIHARVYTPKEGNAPFPVIVYYHGGSWVIADNDTYNASAQGLAEQVGAIVVSVEYRKGPESKFPTAHNDAFDAYQFVLKNAASMKVDTSKIAVVGERAGGNLAANVSIMARDKRIKMPVYEVLIYPVANNDMNSASYQKYAMAKPLNKAMMGWFTDKYLHNMGVSADPRI